MTITKDFNGTVFSSDPNEQEFITPQKDYHNSTYAVVSKVAYLIGVPQRIFELEYEPPKMEHFKTLTQNKNARIIRHLCMLRTAIEQNYGELNYQMTWSLKNLHSFPDLIPQDALRQLEADGISIVKANYKLNQYIIDINHHISNRINNCKSLFPIWLEWGYVKDLFIMPNGLAETGIKAAAAEYYGNKNRYPYGQLKSVNYYVMVESNKFGADHRNALIEAGIPFCYIDNFCTGNSNQIKVEAMLREIRNTLDEELKLNVNDMLREAYLATRAEMSKAEQKQFYDRYIKPMRLVIGDNGGLSIILGL